MSRFATHATPLAGLLIVERKPILDERGSLVRLFCASDLTAEGFIKPVEQINLTITQRRGTVRGMHFQRPPHAEVKLVSCIRGCIFDVAVDIRSGSPTFLQWHAEELSADNNRGLLIPEGFAHGFQALNDNTELVYVHSAAHVANSEGGLNALDPRLAISWPLSPGEMSSRDRGHRLLDDNFGGISA